ncbi:MAG TPA: tetratricopeptide repeat protein [Gemmatimonadales bacterium]|nr:tetratricopeptide repeat protein [Gemmatimonadales bacterium]
MRWTRNARVVAGLASWLLLSSAIPAVAGAQRRGASFRDAAAALARGDYAEAERLFAQVAEAAPEHPIVLHQYARAQALAGHPEAALATLERALARGAGHDADRDSAFAALWPHPGFAPLRATIEARRRPVRTSAEAFTIAERDLVPEGIAYDPKGRRFFVGSLHKGTIVAVSAADTAARRTPHAFVRLPLPVVVGLEVDPERRRLWAAAGTPQAGALDSLQGRSTLFAIDADRGAVVQSWSLGGPGERHFFNDVAVARDGSAYVSDTDGGAVFRARVGRLELEVIAPPGTHPFANGLALSADERLLYVASGLGLQAIELATGQATAVAGAPEPLMGIDGLVRHGCDLVAIQNALGPARVLRLRLGQGGRTVERVEVLEANHPLFEGVPTTGTLVDRDFHYIANSELRRLAPQGGLAGLDGIREPVILRTALGDPRC